MATTHTELNRYFEMINRRVPTPAAGRPDRPGGETLGRVAGELPGARHVAQPHRRGRGEQERLAPRASASGAASQPVTTSRYRPALSSARRLAMRSGSALGAIMIVSVGDRVATEALELRLERLILDPDAAEPHERPVGLFLSPDAEDRVHLIVLVVDLAVPVQVVVGVSVANSQYRLLVGVELESGRLEREQEQRRILDRDGDEYRVALGEGGAIRANRRDSCSSLRERYSSPRPPSASRK